jgi:hypothetical protein
MPSSCPASTGKSVAIGLIDLSPKSAAHLACPVPKEGRCARHQCGTGCDGRRRRVRRSAASASPKLRRTGASPGEAFGVDGRGRRSRVVLTPRRWCQVFVESNFRESDGGKRARSPGRARSKPINHRAGNAGSSWRTCGNYARVLFLFRTRGCGCGGHPAFPAPSAFGGGSCTARANSRRESESLCLQLFENWINPRRPGQAKRDPGPITTDVYCCEGWGGQL